MFVGTNRKRVPKFLLSSVHSVQPCNVASDPLLLSDHGALATLIAFGDEDPVADQPRIV